MTAAFSKVGLVNLQRLNMRSAYITTIKSEAFRDLKILIELDLSHNLIEDIPKDAFIENARLRHINLNNNLITNLIEEQFPILLHLKKLEIQNCRILNIHPRAFVNVANLEFLDLSNNSLSSLTDTTIQNFNHIKMLLLDGNPWDCDCNLRVFYKWYIINHLSSEMPTCWQPRSLRNRDWASLKSEELVCSPELEMTLKSIEANPGDNVTLGCLVNGNPLPNVIWKFEDKYTKKVDTKIKVGWNNLTLFNISISEGGAYSCIAESAAGRIRATVSVILANDVTAAEILDLNKKNAAGTNTITMNIIVGGLAVTLTFIVFGIIQVWHMRYGGKTKKKRIHFADLENVIQPDFSDNNGVANVEELSAELKLLKRRPKSAKYTHSLPVVIQIEQHCETPSIVSPSLPSTPWSRNSSDRVCIELRSLKQKRLAPNALTSFYRSQSVSQKFSSRTSDLKIDIPNSILPFDNMGPRVTMNGSSFCSLPEMAPETHSEYLSL